MFTKIALCAFFFVITQAFEPQPNPYDDPVYFGNEFSKKWNDFQGKFNKTYATQTEENVRMMIFRMNLMAIDAHNAARADNDFEMGITYYTDFTPREFSKVLGTVPNFDDEEDSGEYAVDSEEIETGYLPQLEDVDYSKDENDCIGPVEHQRKYCVQKLREVFSLLVSFKK